MTETSVIWRLPSSGAKHDARAMEPKTKLASPPLDEDISARLASPAGVEDASRLRDPAASRQGPARVILVVGPVGAGKSTFAEGLARDHAAVRLTLDQWMTQLFSPDRPDSDVMAWYVERAARCIDRIWSTTRDILAVNTAVVLEIGLLSRREREKFYERAGEARVDLSIYVVDAPRDIRRARVEARNRERGSTFSMIVPPQIFELASDLWEPPDPDECSGRDVRFLRTDTT